MKSLNQISEEVTANFPRAINEHGDLSKHYDIIEEAYKTGKSFAFPQVTSFFRNCLICMAPSQKRERLV